MLHQIASWHILHDEVQKICILETVHQVHDPGIGVVVCHVSLLAATARTERIVINHQSALCANVFQLIAIDLAGENAAESRIVRDAPSSGASSRRVRSCHFVAQDGLRRTLRFETEKQDLAQSSKPPRPMIFTVSKFLLLILRLLSRISAYVKHKGESGNELIEDIFRLYLVEGL